MKFIRTQMILIMASCLIFSSSGYSMEADGNDEQYKDQLPYQIPFGSIMGAVKRGLSNAYNKANDFCKYDADEERVIVEERQAENVPQQPVVEPVPVCAAEQQPLPAHGDNDQGAPNPLPVPPLAPDLPQSRELSVLYSEQQRSVPGFFDWATPHLKQLMILSPTMVVGGVLVTWLIYLKINKSMLEKTKNALTDFAQYAFAVVDLLKNNKIVRAQEISQRFNYYRRYMKALDPEVLAELSQQVESFAQAIEQCADKSHNDIPDIITKPFGSLCYCIEADCLPDIKKKIEHQTVRKSGLWLGIKERCVRWASTLASFFDDQED